MIGVDTFKHLLPRARAWSITLEKKLRQFFEGLAEALIITIKENFDNVYSDLDPQQTRDIPSWETQFGLPNTDLTEQERRDRLDATWSATGGQSPRYIQDTLQNAGFPVYVHEWWVPGSEPAVDVKACVTPRDPTALLIPPNYPLVNKIREVTQANIVQAGEPLAQAGEPTALAGNYLYFTETLKVYELPTDPDEWPYFMYIGAQTFGNFVNIPVERKDEFEDLCLKIGPCHIWIGLFVNFT